MTQPKPRVLTTEQKLAWVNQVVLRALKTADIDTTVTTTPNGMRLELVLTGTDRLATHLQTIADERDRLRNAASGA